MKKKTKFGLVLAAVAAATFYVVHKLAGKKAAAHAAPENTQQHTNAPPSSTPKTSAPARAPSSPASSTPADPFKPLPGQEDAQGNIHFDQPGTEPTGLQDQPGANFSAHASSDDPSSSASHDAGGGWTTS